MKHWFENHDLVSEHGSQLIDLTSEVRAVVGRAGVVNGMILVYSPHTTCAIMVNELDDGITADLTDTLEALAPEAGRYRHDDPERRHANTDGTPHAPNGHSHVRAGVIASSSQTFPIVDGQLLLGRYQRVLFCELDCARPRKVFMQVIGE